MGCGASSSSPVAEPKKDVLEILRTVNPEDHDSIETLLDSLGAGIATREMEVNALLVEQSHVRDDARGLVDCCSGVAADVARAGASILCLRNFIPISPVTYTAVLAAALARADLESFPPKIAPRLVDAAKKDGVQFCGGQLNTMILAVLSEHNALVPPVQRGVIAEEIIHWLRQHLIPVDPLTANVCLATLLEDDGPEEATGRLVGQIKADGAELSAELFNDLAVKILSSECRAGHGEQLLFWMQAHSIEIRPETYKERQAKLLREQAEPEIQSLPTPTSAQRDRGPLHATSVI